MKILVFGSLNIDNTYIVKDFVAAKQTIDALDYQIFCGGKGFNQAISLANSGQSVYFMGACGNDGERLLQELVARNVDISLIKKSKYSTGQALIQVNEKGENCIIINHGANYDINKEDIDSVLGKFNQGDLIVMQNEISNMPYLIKQAKNNGLITIFNPSPFNETINECDLSLVDYLFINEVEGNLLTNTSEPQMILTKLHQLYPWMNIILTLGASGSLFSDQNGKVSSTKALNCEVVDTTGAGDTYTGYFISEYIVKGKSVAEALKKASIASGISVGKKGALNSIPTLQEVNEYEQ